MQAYILSINGENIAVILRSDQTAMASAICQAVKYEFTKETAEIITDIPQHNFATHCGEIILDDENYDFSLENVTIY